MDTSLFHRFIENKLSGRVMYICIISNLSVRRVRDGVRRG